MNCCASFRIRLIPSHTLCAEFYDYEEIHRSKVIIHELSDVDSRPRFVNYLGDDKAFKDMKDILFLCLQMKVPYQHRFVIRNLANIPPISLMNCDSAKLLNEIENLKTEMKIVINNQKHFTEEMVMLKRQKFTRESDMQTDAPSRFRFSSIITGSALSSRADERGGSYLSQKSRSDKTRDEEQKDVQPPPMDNSDETHPKTIIDVEDEPDDRRHSSHANEIETESESDRESHRELYTPPIPMRNRFSAFAPMQSPRKISRTFRRTRTYEPSNRSYAQVTQAEGSQRPVAKTVQGNGANLGIHAASNSRPHQGNKRCTGLFVTRLLAKTPAENLQRHIQKETGQNLHVVKLKTRYDSYSSFHVKCDKQTMNSLMNSYLWPKGTFVKPFFE